MYSYLFIVSSIELTTNKMPDWAYYLTLSLFFVILIIFSISIWIFAKWLTVGPKIKRRFKKIIYAFSKKEVAEGLLVNKNKVDMDDSYIQKLEEEINNETNPQKLLDLQSKKEKLEKQYKLEKERIKKLEEKKLEKLEMKKDKKRIKKEAKEISNELKKEKKEISKKTKK